MKNFEEIGLWVIIGWLIVGIVSTKAFGSEADAIRAKEEARQAQCAEIRGYSVSTKCGVVGTPFGFNLPDDYKAADIKEKYEERWICTKYEMRDRIVHQCRSDHTIRITTSKTRTWVEYK